MSETEPRVVGRPFDPVTASAAGRAGAASRKRAQRVKERVRADVLAKQRFEKNAEKLAQVLIDAALGKEDFQALSPRERAQFAQKALEYAVGRPRPTDAGQMDSMAGPGLVFEGDGVETQEPVETQADDSTPLGDAAQGVGGPPRPPDQA